MTEQSQQSVQDMVKIVADAIDKAVATYGPQAVDLATMVYRVEAIQQLVNAGVYVSISLLIVWIWLVPLRKMLVKNLEGVDSEEPFWVIMTASGFLAAIISLPMFFMHIQDLIYIPYWIAAFGSPELFMATKALSAAGAL